MKKLSFAPRRDISLRKPSTSSHEPFLASTHARVIYTFLIGSLRCGEGGRCKAGPLPGHVRSSACERKNNLIWETDHKNRVSDDVQSSILRSSRKGLVNKLNAFQSFSRLYYHKHCPFCFLLGVSSRPVARPVSTTPTTALDSSVALP